MIKKTKLFLVVSFGIIFFIKMSASFAVGLSAVKAVPIKAESYSATKKVSAYDGGPELTINIQTRHQAVIGRFSSMDFRLTPVYMGEAIEGESEAPVSHATLNDSGNSNLDFMRAVKPRKADTELSFSVSSAALPSGVTGYRLNISGLGNMESSSGDETILKPENWQIHYWYFYNSNKAGVRALINCHNAWLSFYPIGPGSFIASGHHCPNHGFTYTGSSATKRMSVDFDGNMMNRYRIYYEGGHWTATYYPGDAAP